jgi:FlaA1/EpsC-like NDP-sugar epimerase
VGKSDITITGYYLLNNKIYKKQHFDNFFNEKLYKDIIKKRCILLTGGAGLIGSNLSNYLLKEGYPIICFDKFDDNYNRKKKEKNIVKCKNFKLYEGDITKASDLTDCFSKQYLKLLFI